MSIGESRVSQFAQGLKCALSLAVEIQDASKIVESVKGVGMTGTKRLPFRVQSLTVEGNRFRIAFLRLIGFGEVVERQSGIRVIASQGADLNAQNVFVDSFGLDVLPGFILDCCDIQLRQESAAIVGTTSSTHCLRNRA